MFISILKTFLKTIVLSLLLIVAFGLVFFMLFHIPGVAVSQIVRSNVTTGLRDTRPNQWSGPLVIMQAHRTQHCRHCSGAT